jgi:mannose-6-phosphate isomerase-like protein (cupin superfamily)
MAVFTLKRIDDLASINHGAVKLAGDGLGVRSFGLQVLDLPARFEGYPAHDHRDDGQEEVYLVLDGAAEFEIDGDRVHAEAGTMVRVDPVATRKLMPAADGVRVVAIGCALGRAYERPDAFRSTRRT